MNTKRSAGVTLVGTVVAAVAIMVAAAAPEARAVITTPIPAATAPAPPPIPALPSAGEAAPPAAAISDPIEPAAACGNWYLQSNYGGVSNWHTNSTWWEYSCTFAYPQCLFACNADYIPSLYVDSFYWDGTQAVFYGEFFGDYYYTDPACDYWWDEPTGQWYVFVAPGCGAPAPANAAPTASFTFSCSGLSCAYDGSGSTDSDGIITAYQWTFGDGTGASGATAQHTYSGTGSYTATLTVTDNGGASALVSHVVTLTNVAPVASFAVSCNGLGCTYNGSGSSDGDGTIVSYSWSFGDGAGATGVTAAYTYGHAGTYSVSLTVTDNGGASTTVSKDVAVTNNAPTAAFTVSCFGLRCTLDGTHSADSDGTITVYAWSFGDGAGASGSTTVHDYPKAGTYTVTLTVTDNGGDSAVASQRINPISISARGYKAGGQQKVDLAWNGVAGASFDVYRDGAKVAAVASTAYTDVVPKGPGTHTYKVCASAAAICSSDATVTF